MNNNKETLRILIIDSDAEKAETILNVFRDAGHATRGCHITSVESLEGALAEHRRWNLLLISDFSEDLTFSSIDDCVARQGRDIPAIAIIDSADASETFELTRLGARSVVPLGNNDHLLLSALKEVEDLNIRRHYRRMSVALYESEKQRRMLLDDQVDAIVYISDGIIRYTNPAFMELTGSDENESLTGKRFRELVGESDRQQVEDFLINTEDSGQAMAVIQCPLLKAGTTEQPVRAVITPTSFEGEFTLSLLVRPNVSETEQVIKQEVIQKTSPGSASGLFNKQQFQAQLDVAVQRAVAGKGKTTLLCMTLDSLRAIHEKDGRKVSQPLLIAVAKQLGGSLDKEHTAASWGGGVFMILLKVEEKNQVQVIADKILTAISSEPVAIGEHSLPVKISLGGIVLTDTSNDLKTLLVQARHAATQAQKQGGGRLCFYQKRKVKVVSDVEKQLAGMVSQALNNDALRLFYQPVVSLQGSSDEYYEVFLRMTDVRGREHDAASFRAKLDKNALWGKVDRWQLIQASKDLMAKRKDGHNTCLIVHVGASAVTDASFVPWLGVALKAAGIPPQAVAIELSEPNLTKCSKNIPDFFKELKGMGCQIAISDFGCGLNPMAAIAPLDVDLVRMDASFTKELTSADKGDELKQMIGALAKKQCKVIVPQVESAAEMAPLWQCGVDFIQGPFLQSPSQTMSFDFESDI